MASPVTAPPKSPPLPLVPFAVLGGLLLVLVAAGFFKEERREWRGYQERFRADFKAADRAASESLIHWNRWSAS